MGKREPDDPFADLPDAQADDPFADLPNALANPAKRWRELAPPEQPLPSHPTYRSTPPPAPAVPLQPREPGRRRDSMLRLNAPRIDDDYSAPVGALGQPLAPPQVAQPTTWGDVGQAGLDFGQYLTNLDGSRTGFVPDLVAGEWDLASGLLGAARAGARTLSAPRNVAEGYGVVPGQGTLDVVANWLDEQSKYAEARSKELSPQGVGATGAFRSGVKSAGQLLPVLPFAAAAEAPSLLAGILGVSQGGQAYQEATTKGLANTPALAYAIPQAVIEYATEHVPGVKLLTDVKTGVPIIKMVMNNLAREVPGEQIATLTQDFNKWAMLQPDKSFMDYIRERPSAALDTFIATLTTGGLLGVQQKGLRSLTPSPTSEGVAAGFAAQQQAGEELDPTDVLAQVLGAKPGRQPGAPFDASGQQFQYGAPTEDVRNVATQPVAFPPESLRSQPQPQPTASFVGPAGAFDFAGTTAAPTDVQYTGLAAAFQPSGEPVAGQLVPAPDSDQPGAIPGPGAAPGTDAAAAPDAALSEDPFADLPEAPADDVPELDAPSSTSTEEAMRALGFSEDEIAADPTVQAERRAQQPAGDDQDIPGFDEPSNMSTADAMRAMGMSEEEIAADPQVRKERLAQLEKGYFEPDEPGSPEYRSRLAAEVRAQRVLDRNPLAAVLKGKLKLSSAADYGADLARRQGTRAARAGTRLAGGRTAINRQAEAQQFFAKPGQRGMEVDEVGHMLQEHGYFPPGAAPEAQDVYDMVRRMLDGENIHPEFDAKGGAEYLSAKATLEARDARDEARMQQELDADLAMAENIYGPDFAFPPELYDALFDSRLGNDARDFLIRQHYNAFVQAERGRGSGEPDANKPGAAQPGGQRAQPRGRPANPAGAPPAQQGQPGAEPAAASQAEVAALRQELQDIGQRLDRGRGDNPGRRVSRVEEARLRARMDEIKALLRAADEANAPAANPVNGKPRPAAPAANPVNGKPRPEGATADDSLLLMPCSEGKLPQGGKAGEIYRGSMWQVLRKHLQEGAEPHMAILSAKHGFLDPEDVIEAYEQELTAARRAELLADIPAQVRTLRSALPRGKTFRDVQIVGGANYREIMRAAVAQLVADGIVEAEASVRETTGAIGQQRQQLGQYLDTMPAKEAPGTQAATTRGGTLAASLGMEETAPGKWRLGRADGWHITLSATKAPGEEEAGLWASLRQGRTGRGSTFHPPTDEGIEKLRVMIQEWAGRRGVALPAAAAPAPAPAAPGRERRAQERERRVQERHAAADAVAAKFGMTRNSYATTVNSRVFPSGAYIEMQDTFGPDDKDNFDVTWSLDENDPDVEEHSESFGTAAEAEAYLRTALAQIEAGSDQAPAPAEPAAPPAGPAWPAPSATPARRPGAAPAPAAPAAPAAAPAPYVEPPDPTTNREAVLDMLRRQWASQGALSAQRAGKIEGLDVESGEPGATLGTNRAREILEALVDEGLARREGREGYFFVKDAPAAPTPEPAAEGEDLESYTPEEIVARQEAAEAAEKAKAKADKEADEKAKAEREAKEVAARQAASAEGFQLGQSPEEGLSGQQRLDDADLESKAPPSGVTFEYQNLAFTHRPSVYRSAWDALGLSAGVAENLPIEQQYNKLAKLYQSHFGLRVEKTKTAHTVQAVDNMLDGFQNIQAMMAVLGLPANAVGLNGTLSVTFEKYNQKKGYLGAYDPVHRMVFMPGRSNSFGHEWMHALDHMLTTIAGQPGTGGLFSYVTRGNGANPNDRLQGSFAMLMTSLFHDHAQLAWQMLQLQVKASERTKAGAQSPAARKAEKQYNAILAGKESALKGVALSEYVKSSVGFGGVKYWGNPAEMLARAFEAYLSAQRGKSQLNEFVTKPFEAYLSNADRRFAETFPKDTDRAVIFNAFDDFFAALRVSNELGHGPRAQEFPAGQGVYDPQRWQVYPNNQPAWRRIIDAEKQAYLNFNFPTWAKVVESARTGAREAHDWGLTWLASQRGHMNALYWRYGKNRAIRQLADTLFADRGHGRDVRTTYHEAVTTRTRRKMNEVNGIMRKHGLAKLTRDESQLMRLIMVSAETMTHHSVVRAMGAMSLNVPNDRIDKVEAAAADLRGVMKAEWYHNESNGINLGYTKNGYLPRILNYEHTLANLDAFEDQARKVYEIKFDRTVGTDNTNVDLEELEHVINALVAITNDPSSRSPGLSGSTMQAIAELKKLRQQLSIWKGPRKDDPKAPAKIDEIEEQIRDAIDELLPLLRQDYMDSSAHAWRMAVDALPTDEYDKTSPQNNYTKSRDLPPEADVLMQDFYRADPVEAITEYLERSTRRVEYARRFGVKGEKLEELYQQMRAAGVPKHDRDLIDRIVTIATGREGRTEPLQLTSWPNRIMALQTMYMLNRATFTSLSETLAAFLRTGHVTSLFKPFLHIAQDVFNTSSSRDRQQLANLLGLVGEPFADAQFANRLAGDTLSRVQAERMSRFFERTLLAPLTRAQQRSMIAVGHVYLKDLVGKPDSKSAVAELAEMGIARADQKDFKKWLDGLKGKLPSDRDLIDPHTGDFHKEGMLYGTMLKRFGDQVIMEPAKMDRPQLATHPVARFAFGIMSFQYAFWSQVYKPTVQATIKNALTVASATTGGRSSRLLAKGAGKIGAGTLLERIAGGPLTAADFNQGRTGMEAARGLVQTTLGLLAIYVGQLMATVLRAWLLDRDKWEEHERKGTLVQWLSELAFWRTGAAGILDPVVQAFRGLKYERDLTGLVAGPQVGSILQNIQDIGKWAGSMGQEGSAQGRKAARAAYNLTLGPLFTWAAASAPGGPVVGTAAAWAAMVAGSGQAQERVSTWWAGKKFDRTLQKRTTDAEGNQTVRDKTPEELRQSLKRTKKEQTRQRLLQELRAE